MTIFPVNYRFILLKPGEADDGVVFSEIRVPPLGVWSRVRVEHWCIESPRC